MAYRPGFNKELYNWFLFQLYRINEEWNLYVPEEVLVYSAKVLAKENKYNSRNRDWLDVFRNAKDEFEMLCAVKEAGEEKIIRGGWFYESYKFLNLGDVIGLGRFFFQQASELARNLNLNRESSLYGKVAESFEDLIVEIRELRRNVEELGDFYNLFGKDEGNLFLI